jgi:hypothetical protein
MTTRASVSDSMLGLVAGDQSYFVDKQSVVGKPLEPFPDGPSNASTNPLLYSDTKIHHFYWLHSNGRH